MAHELSRLAPSVTETGEWGLDHGAWPMLMHLFPDAGIPVFQMSIDYYAKPENHFPTVDISSPTEGDEKGCCRQQVSSGYPAQGYGIQR